MSTDNEPLGMVPTAAEIAEATGKKAKSAKKANDAVETETAGETGPAASHDLKDNRKEYPQKTRFGGGTVKSLTRAERNNRVGVNAIYVICPQHGTACKNGGTEGIMSRYYCTVEGCKFNHKLVQPTLAQKIDQHAKARDSKRS